MSSAKSRRLHVKRTCVPSRETGLYFPIGTHFADFYSESFVRVRASQLSRIYSCGPALVRYSPALAEPIIIVAENIAQSNFQSIPLDCI
jgi:hypothetical protein